MKLISFVFFSRLKTYMPVVLDSGVGDLKEKENEASAWFVLKEFDSKSLDEAVETIPN